MGTVSNQQPPVTEPRTVAVVVSFNRRELLLKTLQGIVSAVSVPAAVVVVDNGSSDGSADAARGFSSPVPVDVVALERNTGGAGGFTVGLAHALAEHHADLVWLMDDDTVPTEGTLAEALKVWTSYAPNQAARPAFVASKVVWTDGRDHPMNTPRQRPGVTAAALRLAADVGAMPVRSASFVSLLVDAAAVRRVGLPVADYFLWNDDFEYSTRLARHGAGLYAPASVVVHHTKTFGSTDADPGERFFWEVRNKSWMWLRSRSLAPAEKLLYGGSSLLRWGRTVRKSRNKGLLLRCLAKGLAAGAGTSPRPNSAVLDGVYELPEQLPVGTAGGRGSAAGSGGAPLEFSVLLPIYDGDDAGFFRRAFASVTADQTRPPAEVVIVRDGPLNAALAAAVDETIAASSVPVVDVPLKRNEGLAAALDAGLLACTHEVVARMDADDVSLPDRFKLQLPVIEAGADLVGSALEEFSGAEDNIVAVRRMETDPARIAREARFKDPFNHPSVVYRKSAVAAAGGYRRLDLMEDYWLFARMIASGASVANVEQSLLKYRVSSGAYARRGGIRLLRAELELQARFLGEGFTGPLQFARNVAIRGGYRLVPEPLRRAAYRTLIAARPGR